MQQAFIPATDGPRLADSDISLGQSHPPEMDRLATCWTSFAARAV